ncbi:hypothetical protein GLOTRDRAFT_50397 [Gloeophyllum trabeum ATCC 11539]|uniref:Uncharacterized protein n=1 Tax=Gloeophyllum trabeum (strain ATCC 11539 / FP-39264 / Madison 617) TaxID=670483 RepID=S7R814_GLOTA|nr:uncharacterized protein GLOTRDRAFT_50397 [Gloeophyllum trabeum ATCC 11539]EPQ50475.1 hypothetical protein GLOTRDRAFT_50397 [Gloeophyllum trabeum ATCC 11539]
MNIGGQKKYYLTGIIYHGDYHFNCRFIGKDGTIWYNDGMVTGRNCIEEGNLTYTDLNDLNTCKGKTITIAIYSRRY